MVLDKLGRITQFNKRVDEQNSESSGVELRKPQHIAITMEGIATYCKVSGGDLKDCYHKSYTILKNLILFQVKSGIQILTVNVLPESLDKASDQFSMLIDELAEFLQDFIRDKSIHENKIKVTIFGKWYDLPAKIIDPIKRILDETKDYDSFFFNLCINYNGQEEIVDAVKIIAQQIRAGKTDPDQISQSSIKDNLYSSYFIPPDVIIKTGVKPNLPSLLLWDSPNAFIYFTKKHWPELRVADLQWAIKEYQK